MIIFKKVNTQDDDSRMDMLDADYDIRLCNDSFQQLFGVSLRDNKFYEAVQEETPSFQAF